MVTKRYGDPFVEGGAHSFDHPRIWSDNPDESLGAYVCPRLKPRRTVFISYSAKRPQEDIIEYEFVQFLHGVLLAEQRPGRLTTLAQATKHYVEMAKQVPEVEEVWLSDDVEDPTIWTIIAAPRLDKASRNRIYEIQIETLRKSDRPLVDFRLLNVNELSEPYQEFVLPTRAKMLWAR